jgi:hypothetical protein
MLDAVTQLLARKEQSGCLEACLADILASQYVMTPAFTTRKVQRLGETSCKSKESSATETSSLLGYSVPDIFWY